MTLICVHEVGSNVIKRTNNSHIYDESELFHM